MWEKSENVYEFKFLFNYKKSFWSLYMIAQGYSISFYFGKQNLLI